VLTLRRDSDVVWRRTPEDFEDFDYPLHALVADEGGYLVFGGVSVHNFGNYDEGLRLYDGDGHLVRFVSRKDLPPGHYSISTAHWYDAERSHIEGTTLVFYTPGRDAPIRFDLKRGTALPEGAVVPGQAGDDFDHFERQWLQPVDGAPSAGSSPMPKG
ncbi:MAG: hypothetical protein AAGD06_34235, partial [Acidobacteriota bacterium]